MLKVKKSVLLKLPLASDLQYSAGFVSITGLNKVRFSDIVQIKQIVAKDEVKQVVRIGGGTSYTPTANTAYTVEIGDPNAKAEGWQKSLKRYSFVTPAVLTTIGATAALQREYINGNLVAKINADASNNVVALSLGTGSGFTITDDGDYFPARPNSFKKGASTVVVVTNADGTGFVKAADLAVTVEAVYAFGIGDRMLQDKVVINPNNGAHLISGEFDAPKALDGTYAEAGKKYDAFSISAFTHAPAISVTGQMALVPNEMIVFADKAAAGFAAFERAVQKLIAKLYQNDENAVIDFFDKITLFQGPAGIVPLGTGVNKYVSPYTELIYTNIGDNDTIVTPTPVATGLRLDQKLTATLGAEYTPNLLALNSKKFVVGKQEFSVFAKIVAADWTDAAWLIGFRKDAAHAADFNNYTDLAAIGSLAADGDLITTQGILNNAATSSTSTAVIPVDATAVTVEVKVAINGLVTAKLNDVVYPIYSAGTTPLVLDAGDEIIPFVRAVNIGGGDPDLDISKLIAVPDANWRL